jgi:RNA polymerase-interacting CarD/CdnL/TRCF family regulator
MRLEVGDLVVYAAYGVGRIVAREKRPGVGSASEVVVIELSNDLTVSLPIERAGEQLRSLATQADIRQIQAILRAERAVSPAPWLARQRESRAKLSGGDPVDLAEIVRDGATRLELLTRRGAKGQLPEGERHLFSKARLLLATEIGHVRGLATTDADDWIGRQLANSA